MKNKAVIFVVLMAMLMSLTVVLSAIILTLASAPIPFQFAM
jgi:hypothetical protein